ncbi:hypothetical protein GOBAR_AA10095 [Gossypium barbadense]|uniref:Uncharacterized protein n=1 Tax=Gossypium barbadense TaxID=3634 RepID=A0A2P5Y4I2_GOSBA|nr:hypothetical protein GOBAR_AA10095 [Gossypium barbadense]
MSDWGPIIVALVLFVLLTPGLLFQVPGHHRKKAVQPKKLENNITYMDVSLYKAAAEGKIEDFNNYRRPELESLKTPNHDNVLHLNLSTSECIGNRTRSDFIEQILSKCPSLLPQTNAKGQTPLHVAARNGHSAIVNF